MIYKQYYDHLLAGNRRACSDILHHAMLSPSQDLLDIYQNFIQKSLYEIGVAWQQNTISVAQEHMATAISEGLLNELYQYISSDKKNGKKIIITSAERESHRVGGRMICDLFELNGWDSIYVGADTPVIAFSDMVKDQRPDLVGISLSLFFNLSSLTKMINALHAEPEIADIPIIIGGQGLTQKGDEYSQRFTNVNYLRDIPSTLAFAEAFC